MTHHDAPAEGTRAALMAQLRAVKDPEIPVLDVVEMGIVREAELIDGVLHVAITPTYSGCPAMRAIEESIATEMAAQGYEEVIVRTVFDAPWTTDWMTDEALAKLKAYGIAPPEKTGRSDWRPFQRASGPVPCPYCDRRDTRLTSPFGSTPCKALHYCDACHQPFEHFKCI